MWPQIQWSRHAPDCNISMWCRLHCSCRAPLHTASSAQMRRCEYRFVLYQQIYFENLKSPLLVADVRGHKEAGNPGACTQQFDITSNSEQALFPTHQLRFSVCRLMQCPVQEINGYFMCLGKREKMYFQANYETSWEIISQCSRLYDLAETPSLRCAILPLALSSALP